MSCLAGASPRPTGRSSCRYLWARLAEPLRLGHIDTKFGEIQLAGGRMESPRALFNGSLGLKHPFENPITGGIACAVVLLCFGSDPLLLAQSSTSPSDPAALEFFEAKVRPVFANRCYPCHGPNTGEGQAGLRLDSLTTMLTGGRSGPAIVPGEPQRSLFILAINHDTFVQMPPKTKLPRQEIQILTDWVKMGAPWPDALPPPPASRKQTASSDVEFTEEEKSFWAFQRVTKSSIPRIRNKSWPRSRVDHFVLAELEAKGLTPAPPAAKRTLIRRATIDLHGLPPTPEEVTAFLLDESPEAFSRVVNRLLESPRYGERWGRHWLDVVRYADSNGMDDNLVYGDAWRYRDYVIRAFNTNKPYDLFIREQLAGDLLADRGDADRAEGLVATTFLMIGPKMLAEDDPVKQQMDIVDEQLDTASRAIMGLTLGCARCHDHKFDPIPTADYYSLAAIFKSTQTMLSFRVDSKWNATALDGREPDQRLSELEKEIDLHDDILVNGNREKMSQEEREGYEENLKAAKEEYASIPKAMAVKEGDAADLPIFIRGNHLTPGPRVPRRFPRILAGGRQTPIPSGRSGRLELADWLTSPDHPLTARVMVNRIWKGHFGRGIVRSPDNFGRLGERPDNQPLLDWLAVRFVESGWSVKEMHRVMMLSSAYQMSTAFNPRASEIDPENRLLWRMDRRRMEAEVIRDSLLHVSGRLDLTLGGTLLNVAPFVNLSGDGKSRDPALYESPRRSVYLPVLRSAVYEVLEAFDFADPSRMNGRRSSTTVAPQALFMLNSKLMEEAAGHLAQRLLASTLPTDAEHIGQAYELVLSRPPSTAERQEWIEFLSRYEAELDGDLADAQHRRTAAWTALCRVLLASNEFVYSN